MDDEDLENALKETKSLNTDIEELINDLRVSRMKCKKACTMIRKVNDRSEEKSKRIDDRSVSNRTGEND